MFTTDASLVVRAWDGWLAEATGIPPDAARGRRLTELIPDLGARGLLAPFEQVLARGVVEVLAPAFHHYLVPCRPTGGSRTFDRMQQRVTIAPLRDDERVVGTMVAIEDVTARLERERELAAQLQSADPDARLRAAALLAEAAPVDVVDPLVAAIADDNWRVRRAAVEALAGRDATQVTAAALHALREGHRDFNVLSSAIELLARSEADVVEPLLELLRHPDVDLRLQAALALGDQGDDRAVEALIAALDDPDANLRFHAIEALGKLQAAAAVDALAGIAGSGDFFLAFPAVEAMARIGDPSVAPRLVPLLADDLLRTAVASALGRIGDEDVAAPLTRLLNGGAAPAALLAEALTSVYDRYQERYRNGERIAQLVRDAISPSGTQSLLDAVQTAAGDSLRSVAKVLGWLEGPAVDRALTRLLGNSAVRAKVVEYLVRHGERVVDLLIEQLAAEDLDTRQAAAVGLGRIGDRRATPALLEVLARDPELSIVVAGALARIGDQRAFEPLVAMLDRPDAAVRQATIAALNSIGDPRMAARVAPLLRDPRALVRESAVRVAGYFGYAECADDVVRCCYDEDAAVRRAAIEHLPFLDDARAVPLLCAALAHPEPAIRAAAAQALGRVEDARTVGPLVEATADPDVWVRYFAARALGEQRRTAGVDRLVRLAFDDPAGHVRIAAVDALGSIASPATVPVLSELAAGDDSERAKAALRALGSIAHADAWLPLEAALRVADPERRAAAADAVGRFGGAAAVEVLEWSAAADSSDGVAAAAISALARMARGGADRARAIRALVDLLAEPARRSVLVEALASLPEEAIDDVAQGLDDHRFSVRVAIVQALGRMRRVEASRWLGSALDDAHPEVRLAALVELRHLGTRGLERKLVLLAGNDADAAVRRTALAILDGSSSAAPRGAVPVDDSGRTGADRGA